jgi:hypothetical protein
MNKYVEVIPMKGIHAYADQIKAYKAILDATQEVQKYLRYHPGKSSTTIIVWLISRQAMLYDTNVFSISQFSFSIEIFFRYFGDNFRWYSKTTGNNC